MTDAAEGPDHQSAASASSAGQALPLAPRKPWKSPTVITSAMSGANAATVNGTPPVTDGIVFYTS